MTGDPIFYNGDKWAAEAERETQIRYDDSFNKDGTRNCVGCEKVIEEPHPLLVLNPDDEKWWPHCDDCKPANPNNEPVLKSPVVGRFNA